MLACVWEVCFVCVRGVEAQVESNNGGMSRGARPRGAGGRGDGEDAAGTRG